MRSSPEPPRTHPPLDRDRMRRFELRRDYAWDVDDVILYHLAIGAGDPPTDARQLAYTYERNLHVLPAFAVVPPLPALMDALDSPELGIDKTLTLHGEHEVQLHGPLPLAAETRTTVHVEDVLDKGSGALVVFEAATETLDGNLLFVNRLKVWVRGAGRSGGRHARSATAASADRAPDASVEIETLPQQALLFRLLGDKNPLHVDPEVAAGAGLERPILHGLCTFGIVCRAVVEMLLGGDVAAVAALRARFAGVVFPGETLLVEMWREDGRVDFRATVVERQAPGISHGVLTLASPVAAST